MQLRKVSDDSAEIEIPGRGLRVVHGVSDLGVMQRGNTKPFLLVYHPKTIPATLSILRVTLGDQTPVEIVPVGKVGDISFRLLAQGKPVVNAEVNLVLPDGERTKVTTNDDGQTSAFPNQGRYAAGALRRSKER